MSRNDDMAALDRQLLAPVDEAFAAARDRHPGALPCGRGCSACCVAVFGITAPDVWRLREGLRRLGDEDVRSLRAAARSTLEAMAASTPEWTAPWDLRDLGSAGVGRLARQHFGNCPALGDEGECRVYDARPRICRLQGLSFRDPQTGSRLEDFCADVFGSESYSAIPPQPLDLSAQWERESELRRVVGPELPAEMRGGYRTIVAAAIEIACRLDRDQITSGP